MKQQASRTALMVAGYRARASGRDRPICDDPWAAALAGDAGLELARRFDASYAHMERWIALRTAAIDRLVQRSAEPPLRAGQVVVLGAGLDTRAARLARPGRRFFEVDHPATQADKRARLAGLDYAPPAVAYVACDFESDDFLERLAAAGFDREDAALFVWEGVVPYLTEAAVRSTLERVARECRRAAVVFDTLGKRMVERRDISERDALSMEIVDDLGEPVIFGINHTIGLVAECGFTWARASSFDEIDLDLTGTYDRERMFRFQTLTVAANLDLEMR